VRVRKKTLPLLLEKLQPSKQHTMERTKADEIFAQLLKAYEAKGDQDFGAFLKEQAQALGLSEEQLAFLEEGNETIDEFNAKALDLAEAKKQGMNRQEWMQHQLDVALDDRTEEEKAQVVEAINDAMDKRLEDLATELNKEEENGNN